MLGILLQNVGGQSRADGQGCFRGEVRHVLYIPTLQSQGGLELVQIGL